MYPSLRERASRSSHVNTCSVCRQQVVKYTAVSKVGKTRKFLQRSHVEPLASKLSNLTKAQKRKVFKDGGSSFSRWFQMFQLHMHTLMHVKPFVRFTLQQAPSEQLCLP